VADAEAGFGGNLNAFELMKDMIEAGAAGVHYEDQLSSAKKCGHLGGKVLVPTREAIDKLVAARLAADVLNIPTVLIARTDAEAANLITSDIDERDRRFINGERTSEGFYYTRNGLEACIDRGISYAPYADLIWMETSHPDLALAKEFADGVHSVYPGKKLAYNCSPSFNWASRLNETEMTEFREKLGEMGYSFQFITLAGFHALNTSMFELSLAYRERGMAGFSELQQREFALQSKGFTAVKHQSFVGTGYFDAVQNTIQQGNSSTVALADSTETAQF
jgi:isocitrate lyase